MMQFARMMRVVGGAVVVAAAMAGPAHASTVPFGWPVVVDQQTTAPGAGANTGALVKLNPIGSAQPGVQTVVAPDGAALAPGGTNYFVDPTGVVQREDQVYDVADESAMSSGSNTGAIIEVDLVTGKQTLMAYGAPFVNPTALVVEPATDDLLVLDRSAGTDGRGAIFRVHENNDGSHTVTIVHDGGYGTDGPTNWRMVNARAMDIDANGNLIVADRDAKPSTSFYVNGTIFKINPNAAPADVNSPGSTPRDPIAFDASGAPDTPGEYLLDPQGVMVRPDGIYVADSKDNVLASGGGIVRVDAATGVQTLVAGGYGLGDRPPGSVNFFTSALYGVAPVDPTFGTGAPGACTVAVKPTCDDLYALDIDFVDQQVLEPSGMVGVVNPTNTDATANQVGFGLLSAYPFSFNHTQSNTASAFVEPRGLITSRDMPDPPVISVNTGAGDVGLGAAQIIEPGPESPNCGAEGAATCDVKFRIRLNHAWKRTVKVNYVVTPETAGSDVDYFSIPAGTATFLPGETVQTVSVAVKADLLDEPDETLKLTLSSPVNGTLDPSLARSTAIGTILDNDAPPTISTTSPPDFLEANGSVACYVNLSAPSGRTVTVNWGSADGTAVAPGDYTSDSATVVFAPGETSKPVTIGVRDDALAEETENFLFNLSGPTNATLPSGTQCNANILDNDPDPKFTIKDVKSNEGNSGQRQVTLSAALSAPSGKKISVKWATADNAATLSNKDYVQGSGTLELAPGETSKSIVVKIVGDTAVEQDEPFKVVLSSPVNATILAGTANVLIVNDDEEAAAPSSETKGETTTGGTKVCSSRRSFTIRVKKTKRGKAKVVSAKVYVNKKLVTTRKGKRLTAPVVLKGLKRGTYRVVVKAKLSDGRTVQDVRVYHTCYSSSESQKYKK